MTSARFELRQIEAGPHPVIELRGEVDATNAAAFGRELCAHTATGPAILDLSPAEYLDSAGFAVLFRLLPSGAVILVISPTSVLRKAASLVSIAFHDTVDQAMGALTSNR